MDGQDVFLDAANSRPDEYARLNGLSIDSHVNVHLLLSHFQRESTELISEELINDAYLPQIHIPRFVTPIEQISASKESQELLSHAALLGREDNQAFYAPTHMGLTKLKLEHPLLRSNPEYDCWELARRVEEQRKDDTDLTSVPSEPLNSSNDESLEFPQSVYQYNQKLIRVIQEEKLDIPKETLRYLACVLKEKWTEGEQREILDKASRLNGLRDLAITPPLSPLAHDENYFIPNDEVCQIPISSDPSTLFDTDLDRAEADLLKGDDGHLDSPLPLDFNSLANSPMNDLPLLEPNRRNTDSLKVEGPLTPLNSVPISSDLAIDMSEFMNSMDIDHVLDEQQPSILDGKSRKDPTGIFSDDTLAVLENNAASVKRRIEQEQLQTADAIARVEIPTMDFSIPTPGWQKVPSDALSQLKWIEKVYEAFRISPWPKSPQAERELRWSPFPSKLGYISTNERIDDGGTVEAFLDFPGLHDVLTSVDYVWKQPGLAILRELEENDVEQRVMPVDDGKNKDIESLVRKRKLELSNTNLEPRGSSSPGSPIDLIQIPPNTPPISGPGQSGHGQTPNLLLDSNDPFATSTLLSNYVDFHTSKRQKYTQSYFFPSSAKPVALDEVKANQKPVPTIQPQISAKSKSSPEFKPPIPAICTKLEPTSTPLTKVIKALTLERGVFTRLERLCPNVEIIERDFDRWNTLAWTRNSVSRSPVVSPLAAEADVIVSPVTGIVVTTLLKAMQRAPPGHKGLPAARERIRSVALRYERLVVLVSEGNRVDETVRELTTSECAAYADFAGFVAGLGTNAQIYYVGGGDETLAKWLVSFLIRYAPEADEVRDILIQEETLWELLLRRAGMNAYAAQAILGQLRPPDDIPEGEAGKYGLPAFIRMTPIERVQTFRALMGGERVLRRVSEVLETRWN
ncbi:hypothetical protein F4776DRAFT_289477 [Hypoxylon sp. NC0597]|nr:hypothetical protein F4776DRAFT_289477 [Hypoxylon sp. NC0597]